MLHPCLRLFSVLPPPTGYNPRPPGGLWSLCRLSWFHLPASPPTTPITLLQLLQASVPPNVVSCHQPLFIVLSSQGLSSLTQTWPASPLFTGRDPVQTSAHLGVSVPPSGLPWDSGPASHPVSWMECSLSLRTGSQLTPLDFLQNPQMLENRWREAIVR